MMNFKNILAIGAHPDDIEYGCFGFLSQQLQSTQIHIQILSMGAKGDPTANEDRLAESRDSLSVLSPNSFKVRKKQGILESDFQEVLSELEDNIEATQPDLILVHGPHDTHQEHCRVNELVASAARRWKTSVLNYASVSNNLDFRPNFFVELSPSELKLKIEHLSAHQSQTDKFYMQPEYIRQFHQRPYTLLHEAPFCECYEVGRIFTADR